MDSKRFVFIGGLHRSGTTPLARWMGDHPEISSFRDTGVHADEGQHLQDVYPPARRFGGPGRFALNQDSYLTEDSPLVSDSSRERLWASWAPHWDLARPVLLEKSPPNLVRMRFLQELFARSHFLIVVRHPMAVAYATKKWVRGRSLRALFKHWVVAHERCLEDARQVRHAAFVRYEDLVAAPRAEMSQVFRFVGVAPFVGDWEVRSGLNEAYLARWNGGVMGALKAPYRRRLEGSFEHLFRPWGYSLDAPETILEPDESMAPHLLLPSAASSSAST